MLKILKEFDSHKVDDAVLVADEDGIPTDLFWRKRLRDGDAVKLTVEKPTKSKVEDK
jgi:hypothetical protein